MSSTTEQPESPTGGFDKLAQLFEAHAGLQFSDASRVVFERRLAERVSELALDSFAHYGDYLAGPSGEEELQYALDLATTSETYFMRQEYQLRSFVNDVLPVLATRNERTRRLSVWSAGCSTGEEVYTLAALIEDSACFVGWDWRVIGTDLSASRVARARQGVYQERSFRAVGPAFRSRFFVADEQGWSVRSELRRRCQFKQLNLVQGATTEALGLLDVIFCRNVLIYLSSGARGVVTTHLADRLSWGGYLFLGHSESLLNTASPLRSVHLSEDIAYQKPMPSEREAELAGSDP